MLCVVDMLINDSELKFSMSYVRSVLNSGRDSSTDDISKARQELSRPVIPEEIKHHRKPWTESDFNNSSVLSHFDYSEKVRKNSDDFDSSSKKILVLFIGSESLEKYEEIMGVNANISMEKQLLGMIGSEALQDSSIAPAFARQAITFDLQEISDVGHLSPTEDNESWEEYFCVFILDSNGNESLAKEVLPALSDLCSHYNHTLPLIYNFSYSISQQLPGFGAESAQNIASSWFCATKKLQPHRQKDYFLHAIMNMFYPDTNLGGKKNIFNDCRRIMYQNFIELETIGTSPDEAILESCNLTTCGDYFPYDRYQETIVSHCDSLEILRSEVLPSQFVAPNPRHSREKWLIKNIEELISDVELNKSLEDSVAALIGMHEKFGKPDYDVEEGETFAMKLERWANDVEVSPDRINKFFISKPQKQSEKVDRIIYGGKGSAKKLKHFANNTIFDALNDSQTLSRNFAPNQRNWDFLRNLFLLTDLHQYETETTSIDKNTLARLALTSSSTIRNKIIDNLIISEFDKFSSEGGVVK